MTWLSEFTENETTFAILRNSKGQLITIFADRIEGVDDYELTDLGKRVWKHKTHKRLFLELSYGHLNYISLLDETEGRRVVDQFRLSGFDFSAWSPMTKLEYDSVVSKYREIYDRA